MFKQFSQLSTEADGRYATDAELKFLKDYLQTAEQRISAYEKIRDAEDKILREVETASQVQAPHLFPAQDERFLSFCNRDRRNVLRLSTVAMLLNSLDVLQDGFLLWYRTIVKSFNYSQNAEVTYTLLPKVMAKYLAPEEMALLKPVMELDRSTLTS